MRRVRVNWVRYGAETLEVCVHVEVIAEDESVAIFDIQTIPFAEADAVAIGVTNGRTDGEWGNAEIAELVLDSEITGAKVIPGRPAMPAVVDPETGATLREALPAVESTMRTDGLRFDGIDTVIWNDGTTNERAA